MTELWLPPAPDPLKTHRRSGWWVDVLDRNDAPVARLDGVLSGDVSFNVNATIRGGGTLELKETTQIDWLNVRLQPWWSVEGAAPWPLGVFLASAPAARHSESGVYWSVALLDKLSILDEDRSDGSVWVSAGSVVTTTVKNIIEAAGETSVNITPSTATVSSGMVWEAGTSKLQIINDLLASINYFALSCDGYGRYVSGPYAPPASRPTVWDFDDGVEAVHLPSFYRDQDTTGIPNKVVMIGVGSSETEALVGVATNTNPASPYSYPSRGRWITHTEFGVEASSQAVIDALAERSLTARSSVAGKLDIEHAPLPLQLNDVVSFNSGGVRARGVVQKMSQRLADTALTRTLLEEVGE